MLDQGSNIVSSHTQSPPPPPSPLPPLSSLICPFLCSSLLYLPLHYIPLSCHTLPHLSDSPPHPFPILPHPTSHFILLHLSLRHPYFTPSHPNLLHTSFFFSPYFILSSLILFPFPHCFTTSPPTSSYLIPHLTPSHPNLHVSYLFLLLTLSLPILCQFIPYLIPAHSVPFYLPPPHLRPCSKPPSPLA